MTYKMIPVDEETAEWILELCEAYEMGKRSQGALVRKLVKERREQLAETKLLPSQKSKKTESQPKNK
jgi:hypothetical protein